MNILPRADKVLSDYLVLFGEPFQQLWLLLPARPVHNGSASCTAGRQQPRAISA